MEDTEEDNDKEVSQAEEDDNNNNNVTNKESSAENDDVVDPNGTVIAFCCLLLMALVSIFCGASRSVEVHHVYKTIFTRSKAIGTKWEDFQFIHAFSPEKAPWFPLSVGELLCLLYVLLKFFQPKYIDVYVTLWFFIMLGIVVFPSALYPILEVLATGRTNFADTKFISSTYESRKNEFTFETQYTWTFIIGIVLGVWYIRKKHWVANNLFAIAFATLFIEQFHLNRVETGLVLFAGRYVLELFLVVGTDVMATISALVNVPFKLIFPHNLLVKGVLDWDANKFVILGMFDILLPGVFIALMLRIDIYLGRNWQTYFFISLLAYIVDLYIAISESKVFYPVTRPEFLKVVPVCALAPLLLALLKGDIQTMFKYEDYPGMYPTGGNGVLFTYKIAA